MPGDDYREASLRIWDDSRRVGEWLVDAFERHAEGDGYHLPGMCLNVLAA